MDSVAPSVRCPMSAHIARCKSPHLEHIPSLTSLTARSLSGGDLEVLGWETDGSLDAQVLRLRTLDELAAHLLERSDLLGGEGDSDLVDLGLVALRRLLWVLERHVGGVRVIGGW